MNPKDMLIAELKQHIAELEAENERLRLAQPLYSRRQLQSRLERAEANNRILTSELRSYFQQYGWESTERILKYHGAERGTP